MKTAEKMKNQNVKNNFNERMLMFKEDIKTNENLFETTGKRRYKSIANNLRARLGELQYINKVYF